MVISSDWAITESLELFEFIPVAVPKIDAVFANDDQMELDCDDECRGRAIYIPQTLPVQFWSL